MKITIVTEQELALFESLSQGGLFAGQAWCGCFDQRLKRFFVKDEVQQPIGGFVAFEGGRSGFRSLITAPFAPHIALFVRPEFQDRNDEVLHSLLHFLRTSAYSFYKLDLPTQWTGSRSLQGDVQRVMRQTFRLDLNQDVEEILAHMDGKTRNIIRKAQREGAESGHDARVDAGYEMISSHLESKSVSSHQDILRKIIELSADPAHGCWTHVTTEDKMAALNVGLHDSDVYYNLLSAINRSVGMSYAGPFNLYQSILFAKSKGLSVFDFEGSSIPAVARFFASYGSQPLEYMSLSGGKWPWPAVMRWRHRR